MRSTKICHDIFESSCAVASETLEGMFLINNGQNTPHRAPNSSAIDFYAGVEYYTLSTERIRLVSSKYLEIYNTGNSCCRILLHSHLRSSGAIAYVKCKP